MASYNKNNAWAENMVEVANNGSDQFVIYLTAVGSAPVAGNSILGDVTQVAYTNLSTRNITTSTSSQSSGTYKLVFTDLVLTASGGAVAAFRYVGVYDDTPSSPADPLAGWYDYGSALTLADTETLTIDFDGTNGFISLS